MRGLTSGQLVDNQGFLTMLANEIGQFFGLGTCILIETLCSKPLQLQMPQLMKGES